MLNKVLKQFPHLEVHFDGDDNDERWLLARKHGVGGSDVGPICGISKWKSPLETYLDKTGMLEDEELSDFKKNIFHFGHVLEDVVIKEYTLRTGVRIEKMKATMRDKKYPWKLANVDGLIMDDEDNVVGIFEAKTTTEYNDKEWKEGNVPIYYLAQLSWYLHVYNLNYGVIACLVGGNKYYYYEVFRNDDWLNDVILPTVDTFWYEHVMKMVEPPVTGSEADEELLKRLHPAENAIDNEIGLPDYMDDIALKLLNTKKDIKALEKEKTLLENQLKKEMADNIKGYTISTSLTWSPQKQVRLDTTKLRVERPEIFEKYSKEISFKKFGIKYDDTED